MIIMPENLTISSVLTSTKENKNYPANNLKDTRRATFYKASMGGKLSIRFENYKKVHNIVVIGKNIKSKNDIYIQTKEIIGAPMAIPFIRVANHDITEENVLVADLFYDGLVRNVNGFDLFFYSDMDIDTIFISERITMPGVKVGEIPVEDASIANYSTMGQVYGTQRYKYYSAKFTFPYATETERKQITNLYSKVSIYRPFIVTIWEESLEYPPLYVCFTDAPKFKRVENGWETELAIREVF